MTRTITIAAAAILLLSLLVSGCAETEFQRVMGNGSRQKFWDARQHAADA